MLWGMALALPILLFHLYHRRRQRIDVPFIGLLRDSLGPTRHVSRFKWLREAASLATRLLALAAVVLALGGLRPAEARVAPTDLVIVVDGDVTTAATEPDGRSRLVHGLERARQYVRAHIEGRVGVVVAGASPVMLSGSLGETRDALLREIEDWMSRLGPEARLVGGAPLPVPAEQDADLQRAWQMAAEGATARGAGRVLVLSARRFEPPAGTPTQLDGAGVTREDQRFTGFEFVQGAGAPMPVARFRIATDTEAPITRLVRVRLGARTVHEAPVDVAPGEAAILDVSLPEDAVGGWLVGELVGEDALAYGDRVDAWLAPTPRPSVLVVHGDQPRAGPLLALRGLDAAIDWKRSGLVAVGDFAEAPMADVVLVDGVSLPEGTLRPGAYLFLAPLGGTLPFELGEQLDRPLVWRTESDHPLMRWLDFTAADVQRGVPLRGEGLRPLAFADGAVVIAEGQRGPVRYVAIGLDPDSSWLSVQAAVPLLLRRAVLRLATAPTAPLAPFYRVGDPLRPAVTLPGGPEALIRWGPQRTSAPDARREARARVDPSGRAWHVPPGAHGRVEIEPRAGPASGEGAAPTRFPTAFLDLSTTRSLVPQRSEAVLPSARTRPPSQEDHWRRWLVALAGGLLAFDLLLLPRSRRPRRVAPSISS
jgi:hypothetical protein